MLLPSNNSIVTSLRADPKLPSFFAFAIFLLAFASSAFAQSPCSSPEFHQLDFWIGDWDVYDAGESQPSAHIVVDSILGGCALHERYEDTNHSHGESFSAYDPGRKQWRQSWYTDRAKGLELLGAKDNDRISLFATDFDSNPQRQVRAFWRPVEDRVQEKAEVSTDGGKNWKVWFDLSFRPRPSPAAGDTDRDTILQLDTEYQAAVKRNDADTMARHLADNYALISSSGKFYAKADMLAEAKSRAVTYEIQDDTDRVVHLYGDTAVLTGKLHEKGTQDGKPFDVWVVFSDVYVRTSSGWVYSFAQAARLPASTS
jgi:ketosteroid isomerase-like protein